MNPNLALALLGALVVAGSLKLASARTWRKLNVGEFSAGATERRDSPPPPRARASRNSFVSTDVRNLMEVVSKKNQDEASYVWNRIGERLGSIDRALGGDPIQIPESGNSKDLALLLDQLEQKAGLGPLPNTPASKDPHFKRYRKR